MGCSLCDRSSCLIWGVRAPSLQPVRATPHDLVHATKRLEAAPNGVALDCPPFLGLRLLGHARARLHAQLRFCPAPQCCACAYAGTALWCHSSAVWTWVKVVCLIWPPGMGWVW